MTRQGGQGQSEKPNFLIILTDEQPVQTVSAYGNDWVHTPNLDRLAARGKRFDRAYTASPVCTPARAGLLTGVSPHNTGAWANHLALGQDMRTLGHHFGALGYRVAYIGKWHLDGLDYFGTGECPEEFDDRFWYDGRRHLDYLGPERSYLWRSQTLDNVASLVEHGVDREFTWAGQITNRALRFVQEASADPVPWLLVVSYDEPHHPYVCPPEYLERFEGTTLPVPDTFRQGHKGKPQVHSDWSEWFGLNEASLAYHQRLTFAATEFVDDEIGRVIGATSGQDQTYTVFTSDHGNQLGAHGLIWKGPWMYEESIRVPLLMSGPNVDTGVVDQVVSHLDVLPTLLDIVGQDVPEIMDGSPITDLLLDDGTEADAQRRVHVEFNRFQLDRDDFGAFYPIRCIVDGSAKLVINLFDRDELYDLESDPQEKVNLIDDPAYAGVRDQLHEELLDRMYVRRDAFRSPEFERRPWSSTSRFGTCSGRIRTAPRDGLGPEARGDMTGQPIEYDFRL